jgi:arabinosyltransferase C
VAGSPPATVGGFVPDGGWFSASPPPDPPGRGEASEVWGSLPGGGGTEDATGELTTSWWALPAPAPDDAQVAVLAAGRTQQDNRLTAEYADASGTVVGSQDLSDGLDRPVWRTRVLDLATARAEGATQVRLRAADHSGGPGGWLAVTGPSELTWTSLSAYLPSGVPVATAWQVAPLFPCQRQPVVRDGITEPVRYGVLWTDDPTGSALGDNTWLVPRGGLFAPVQRTSAATQLAAVLPGTPPTPVVTNVKVYRFDLPYPTAGYELTGGRQTRPGWVGPP